MFKEKEIIKKLEDMSQLLLNHSIVLSEIKSDLTRLKALWEIEDPKINIDVSSKDETWKTCKMPGMSKYKVSNYGRVKSPTGTILTPARGKTRKGENRPDIRINVKVYGKFTTRQLDKCVAITYFDIDPKYDFSVLHKDNNPFNNKIDNLKVLIK